MWGGITYLALLPFYYSGIDMSDVPFNVLFMFFACVLALTLDDFGNKKIKNIFLRKMFILLSYVFCLALVCRLSIFAFIYIVLIFYYFRKPTFLNVVITALFGFIANLGGVLGVVAVVATLLAMNIDYKAEHKRLIKRWYLFYLYYPLHLVLLLLIKMCA